MANYSRVPHGRIPEEEFIVKDGKTYYPFSRPLKHIQEDIVYHKHKRWGFLIYRCDYASEEAWMKFLLILNRRIEEELKILKAEDLWDTMEMTPMEDKDSLDGATIDQVRDIFKAWVRSNEARAETNDGLHGTFTYPRHTYCVHVDADVLDSVVNRAPQPPLWDWREIGYVNLVEVWHVNWIKRFHLWLQGTDGRDIDESECENGHFVKVPLGYIGPESYDELYGQFVFERLAQYQRSDGVSFARGGLNPEDMYGPLGS